jgi:hypothetical protein
MLHAARNLEPALGKLSEARIEAVGFLKFTNALCKLANTRIRVGKPLEVIDLTLHALDLSQQLALWNLGPALDLISGGRHFGIAAVGHIRTHAARQTGSIR